MHDNASKALRETGQEREIRASQTLSSAERECEDCELKPQRPEQLLNPEVLGENDIKLLAIILGSTNLSEGLLRGILFTTVNPVSARASAASQCDGSL